MTAALLQAILDDPDDIAARRVYADALLADGNPRGELIAVQCAIEDTPPGPDRGALRKREAILLKDHGKAWLAPFAGSFAGRPEFRRGFVEHVTAKDAGAIGALLDCEPIQRLDLGYLLPSAAARLGLAAGLGRVRTLRFNKRLFDDVGEALFRQPLPKLRDLCLADAVDRLALSPQMARQLERLDVEKSRLTEHGLSTLLADPHLAQLRRLRIGGLVAGLDGARLIRDRLALPGLTHLDLSYSRFDAACVAELVHNPIVRDLKALRLKMGDLEGPGSLEPFAAMPRLEVLDVSYNRVENGMRELALLSCPLRVLRLETNGVWAESVVLGAQKFPLEVLDLGSNPSIDLVPICHAGWRLDALDLDMCGLHDEGMAVLAEADFTTSLRRLSINQNMVTDAGLRALVEAEWPRLEELHIAELALQESERTKAGMEALATLPALRTVYLGPERVRRAIVRPLVERGVRIIAA